MRFWLGKNGETARSAGYTVGGLDGPHRNVVLPPPR